MPIDYLLNLARDGEALAAAAEQDLAATVPSCPEWDVGALVHHVGSVHRWATGLVRSRATGFQPFPNDEPAADLVGWYRAGVTELLDVLGSTDPDEPVWNFFGAEPVAGFWRRRQAQETAVHRWDAETAVGAGTRIDAALAADGIDEFTLILRRFAGGGRLSAINGTVHLHATDEGGDWLFRLAGDDKSLEISREPAEADVAVRGTASDLLLFCWGRVAPAKLDVAGDEDLLARLSAATAV